MLFYIYTNTNYLSKTFGTFFVKKKLKPLDFPASPKREPLKNGKITIIVISGAIFIIIICVVLLFTFIRRKNHPNYNSISLSL